MTSIDNYMTSKMVNVVYVGGKVKRVGSSALVKNGFKGCVKVNESLSYKSCLSRLPRIW